VYVGEFFPMKTPLSATKDLLGLAILGEEVLYDPA
jgi:hypothetical protein